ncbi:MAG: tRNA 2-selenouridine(34) synthase MnmH [Phaeodactylibacter sp.]|nr:tRNA 2-selenouridine(34) synthase MnmH [Phaeodactylibacter sp.]MCB9050346.1 tRNA 2-selenouridine(34) synthase MnmH [Lewinellaceae bacterium]
MTVSEVLGLEPGRVLFDVRTPAEYEKGHIPGALNLPLFSNEERAVVGTTYKQVDPYKAFLQGLEFVGPKMRHFVEEARKKAPSGKVAVHCWRGGQRSSSMGWLLGLAGMDVEVMIGGYKAYRNHLLEQFASCTPPLIIVGGPTGSGKTGIIHALAKLGEQVIDLEGIAHHKGSAFGALGEEPQPSVEQFENNLYESFRRLDHNRRIWLENESRPIGRVYIPDPLWKQMVKAPLLSVEMPLELRVKHLVEMYAGYPLDELRDSFERIRRRLGGQHCNAAIDALEAGDYAQAAKIALGYYDKAYNHHTLSKRISSNIFTIPVENEDAEKTARRLIMFAEENDLWLPITN